MTTTEVPPTDPGTAVEALREALASVDIVLPSLSVEAASRDLRLVHLGNVRADVAMKLASALQGGAHE